MQENSLLLLCKWMYTFVCMTASFGFGDSSWPMGNFLAFSLCEKNFLTFSQFSPDFLPFFSPSPHVRKFFSISHSFLSKWEIFSWLLPMWEIFSHKNRELCTDSTYMFLPFSLCEKNFLCFSQFSLYVRKIFSPSPYVRKIISFSPHERKSFLPSP